MRYIFMSILVLLTAGNLFAQQPTPDSTRQASGRADLPKGNAKISFIGYKVKTIAGVIVTKGEVKDLGVIRLSNSTQTLAEVTVEGKKALIEDKVDRLVYNADADLSAKGGDATDILKKVPMLSVDLAGNLSLQGSSNIRVLINNKPSSILASLRRPRPNTMRKAVAALSILSRRKTRSRGCTWMLTRERATGPRRWG